MPGCCSLAPEGKSPVKTAKVTMSASGVAKITIKLTAAGKKKIKAKANGKLKVKVLITFTPTGGTANTQGKSYTLILKK